MVMREHPTTWVKVNALVDKGIAELVVLLNEVEGLQTLESCQGGSPANPDEERPAYVFFLSKTGKRSVDLPLTWYRLRWRNSMPIPQ